jgi:hypothetical protein
MLMRPTKGGAVVVAKPGARLRSVTCDTEVVVVRGGGEEVDLRCGGVAMVPLGGTDEPGEPGDGSGPVAPFDGGTQLGKRYVTEAEDLELLCTKSGTGSLSVAEDPLQLKGAKPLPSSD